MIDESRLDVVLMALLTISRCTGLILLANLIGLVHDNEQVSKVEVVRLMKGSDAVHDLLLDAISQRITTRMTMLGKHCHFEARL